VNASPRSPSCIEASPKAFDVTAARLIRREMADLLRGQQRITLVLPFGRTPMGAFRLLRDEPDVEWPRIVIFNGDEYVGVGAADPAGSEGSLRAALVDPLLRRGLLPESNVRLLDGNEDPVVEVREHCRALATAGGPDLMVLGLGRGPDWESYRDRKDRVGGGPAPPSVPALIGDSSVHLWFNEAGSSFDSSCRVVALSEATKRANGVRWTHAMTLGLRQVREARRLIVLARGAAKRSALDLLEAMPEWHTLQETLRAEDAPIDPAALRAGFERNLLAARLPTSTGLRLEGLEGAEFTSIEVLNYEETEVRRGIGNRRSQTGGLKVLLRDDAGREHFLWFRGSKTEAGVTRIVTDSPDGDVATGLMALTRRLLPGGLDA
jgi:6-phosphogluconolactonase/glucosamine-6-phosphate isomerase/deaminase